MKNYIPISQFKPFAKEIIDEILRPKLDSLEEELKLKKEALDKKENTQRADLNEKLLARGTPSIEWGEVWILFQRINNWEELKEIEEIRKEIANIKRAFLVLSGRATEQRIDLALQVPIESLITEKQKKLSNKIACKCPLHDDKTPSFYIYKETNSFYCFGCGAGGDVIEYVQQKEGLGFIEALKYLT